MIPKIIHYCWFGHGEKPKLAEKCIASWKKYCPDFEIIEWNEDNFDIDSYPYAKYCHDNKKWAFLSDFVRLVVVYKHGGIYFDTDVELVKSPEELLKYDAFFGFENETNVSTGLGFGAIPRNKAVFLMSQQYYELQPNKNGDFPIIVCPALNTKALLPLGLKLNGESQILDDMIVLGIDCLNPYDDPTGKLNKTENTISIHWYSKSWLDKKTIIRSILTKPFHRIFGNDCFAWLKK
ncbi:MAG: glycosyltransferase [Schaedlerella sp.]|nr:glycosyltransferase [Schaedlerella sp.]